MSEYNLRFIFSPFKSSSSRKLDLTKPEDIALVDNFNLNLYNTYLNAKKSKLRDEKLNEFNVETDNDGNVIRVTVKDLSTDEIHQKYSYTLSTRLLSDGTVKEYITRHLQKYHMVPAEKKISKFSYFKLIKNGTFANNEFNIDKRYSINLANPELAKYLFDSHLDVGNKMKLKKLLSSEHKTTALSVEIEDLLKDNKYIPSEFKFTSKQIQNYLYRN